MSTTLRTRWNYTPCPKRDKSQDDIFYKWTYKKKIKVLSTQKDGSVDNYVEEPFWEKEKNSWSEFINSYDLGSVSEQVINHLTKGTPLVTAHTLPAGDYTKLEKGAEIKRELAEKGITLDMIIEALSNQTQVKEEAVNQTAEVKEGE